MNRTMFRLSLPAIVIVSGCAIPWGPEAVAYWRTGATSAEIDRDFAYCERRKKERLAQGGESNDAYMDACMSDRGYELIVRFHCSEEDLKEGFVLSGKRPPLPPAADVLCLKPTEPRGYVVRAGLNYSRAKDYFTETGTW